MKQNKKYFTCGPTELYPDIGRWLQEAIDQKLFSITHRGKEYENIFSGCVTELKALMNIPETHSIFFMSGATECMERIIENLVEEKSAHFVNGAFAERFYTTAKELKKEPYLLSADWGKGNDLSVDISKDTELICITQNETSTGALSPMEEIYALKDRYPDKMMAIDIVTSSPYVKIDFKKIDIAFFSVQKGFGMPAGLGVLIINNKCFEKTLEMKEMNFNIGTYNNFLNAYKYYTLNQNTITPNVPGIYLLWKVCEHLNGIGIEKIRKETEEKASLYYSELKNVNGIEFFVQEEKYRSKTIIVLNVGEKQKAIKEKLISEGYIVSSGYGKFKDTQIRIANFPMHGVEDCKKIIEILKKI